MIRLVSYLLVALGIALVIWLILTAAQHTQPAAQVKTESAMLLYIPMVSGGCAGDEYKGLAGFNNPTTLTVSRSYCEMKIGAAFLWNQVFTHPFGGSPYPLPFAPVDSIRSQGQEWSISFTGLTCTKTRAECAADAVRGKGVIYVLYANEPENWDVNPDGIWPGDHLTPTNFAVYFHDIRDTLWAANPQVRFVAGNFMLPNGEYLTQLRSEWTRLYGGSIDDSVYAWGWHAYAPFGQAPNCPFPYGAGDGACALQSFANDLFNITQTLQVYGIKRWWLTEFGLDPTGNTPITLAAQLLPAQCAMIAAMRPAPERIFLYTGATYYGPAMNNSALAQDGTLSAVGQAYKEC